MIRQEAYNQRELYGRPYKNDTSVERWLKKKDIRVISYGERGMILYPSWAKSLQDLSPVTQYTYITDYDGVIGQTHAQLHELAASFLNNPTEEEVNRLYDIARRLTMVNDPIHALSAEERSELYERMKRIVLPGLFSPRVVAYMAAKFQYSGMTNRERLSMLHRELRFLHRAGTVRMDEHIDVLPHTWIPRIYKTALDMMQKVEGFTGARPIVLTTNGKEEGAEKTYPLIRDGIVDAAVILCERKYRALPHFYRNPDHDFVRTLALLGVRPGQKLIYSTENMHDMQSVLGVFSKIMPSYGLLVEHEDEWQPHHDHTIQLPNGIVWVKLDSVLTGMNVLNALAYGLSASPYNPEAT